MSAFLQSGRFYPGETPIFRVRFRPEAVLQNRAPDQKEDSHLEGPVNQLRKFHSILLVVLFTKHDSSIDEKWAPEGVGYGPLSDAYYSESGASPKGIPAAACMTWSSTGLGILLLRFIYAHKR